jgi:hypothetical protein
MRSSLLVFTACLLTTELVACKSKKQILISQIWRDDVEQLTQTYLSVLSEEERAAVVKEPQNLKRMQQESAQERYHFDADGIFMRSSDNGASWYEAGRWQLLDNRLVVGKDTVWVKKISKKRIVFYMKPADHSKIKEPAKFILLPVR